MLRDFEVPKEQENDDGSQQFFRFHLFLEVIPINKYPLRDVAPALLLGVTVALDVDQIQY